MKKKKEVYFIEDDKVKKWTVETKEVLIYRWEQKYIYYDENQEERKKLLIKNLGWDLTTEKNELKNLEKRQETAFNKQKKIVDDLIEKINNLK